MDKPNLIMKWLCIMITVTVMSLVCIKRSMMHRSVSALGFDRIRTYHNNLAVSPCACHQYLLYTLLPLLLLVASLLYFPLFLDWSLSLSCSSISTSVVGLPAYDRSC